MTTLLLAFTLSTTTPAWGYASAYAPGVMDGVVRVRFENDWWPVRPPADWYTVAGYVATTDCGEVGRVAWLRPAGSRQWSRVLIADCVGDHGTLQWMLDNRIAVELDHGLWQRWTAVHGRPLAIERG